MTSQPRPSKGQLWCSFIDRVVLFAVRFFFCGDDHLPLPLFLSPTWARKLLLLIGQAQLESKIRLKVDRLSPANITEEQFRCAATNSNAAVSFIINQYPMLYIFYRSVKTGLFLKSVIATRAVKFNMLMPVSTFSSLAEKLVNSYSQK